MARILVLGAGVMGAAITVPAAENAHAISLVGTPYDTSIIQSLKEHGWHPGLETQLSQQVDPVVFDAFAPDAAGPPDLVVVAVTSAALSWACRWVSEAYSEPVPVVLVAKGVSADDNGIVPISDFATAELARARGTHYPVVAIAGPCIARDLANKHHTSVVLASRDIGVAGRATELLGTDYYHLHAEPDVDGVEFCAAFKNLYAIAVGWAAGTGARRSAAAGGVPTVNLKATLFARALLEMGYLVEVFGGDDKTALGLAGAGDLYVTCEAGRNGRLGRHMGTGLAFKDVIAGPMRGETIEGVDLARCIAPHVSSMVADGRIDPARVPLLIAILGEICGEPVEHFDFAAILGIQR